MKKKVKKLPFLILLFIAMICGLFFQPTSVVHADYIDNNFKITNYDFYGDVSLSNKISIDEKFDVYFINTREAIVRSLPTIQTVTREINGQKDEKRYRLNYSKISLVDENNTPMKFKLIYQDEFLYIDMPSVTNFVAGSTKTFNLKYTLSLGHDRINEFDDFYFNVLGVSWATSIDNFSFKVDFPKEFDTTFYAWKGVYGQENLVLSESIKGKQISGEGYSFKANEGLTVRLLFEENYFNKVFKYSYFAIIADIIFLGLIVLMVCLFKKNDTKFLATPVVEFNAPKDLTPCEAGFVIDKKIDTKDVSALVIQFANKGYLAIKELQDDTVFVKLKESDGLKRHEKLLFDEIFAAAKSEKIGEEFAFTIKLSELEYGLTSVVQNIKNNVNNNLKDKYFCKKASKIELCFALIASFVLIGTVALSNFIIVSPMILFATVVSAFVCLIISIFILSNKNMQYILKSLKRIVLLIIVTIICSLILFAVMSFTMIEGYANSYGLIIFGVLTSVIGFVLSYRIKTRNKETEKTLGSLIGLKNFIEIAEKDRLEMLVKEDPQAFFHILPYAYVLNVSSTWIDKFDKIAIEAPQWYLSSTPFQSYLFIASLNSMVNKMSSTAFVSPPSTSNSSFGGFSGGGGGGGFSGGGFGGGGGFSR